MSFELGDYVDVAARLAEFREKHPEGSLQPADVSRPYEVVEIGGQTWITVVAAAYRTPDDTRPGIGMAYEQYPGRTPYTKGSELQNAETSAWGRAIVAALAADTRRGGIASKDDVRNRRAEQEQPEQQAEPGPTEAQVAEFQRLAGEITAASAVGLNALRLEIPEKTKAGEINGEQSRLLFEQWKQRLAHFEALPSAAPPEGETQ